ncbi:MAG: endonuclease/exonuclease/phosphatase family protein [Steroidobacteraceae bacterium]
MRKLLPRLARIGCVLVPVVFVLGLLGSHWWLFDLFAHFRVQYGYALLACALLLTLFRDFRWSIPAWIAAAWISWPQALSLLQADAAASMTAQAQPTFKVLTLNAWYRNYDTAQVARYLGSSNADVILVQEFDGKRMRELVAALPSYPHAALAASEDRRGAAILSRWPIESSQPLQLANTRRHAQWALVRWHSMPVQVVAVHLPWPLGPRVSQRRNQELHALSQWMRRAEGPVVVGGDFNLSPWSPHFHAALELANARDAIASRPGMSTWPTQFPPLGIQIDHCLISREWQVMRIGRGPRVGSDHYPVLVELRLDAQNATPRGPHAG